MKKFNIGRGVRGAYTYRSDGNHNRSGLNAAKVYKIISKTSNEPTNQPEKFVFNYGTKTTPESVPAGHEGQLAWAFLGMDGCDGGTLVSTKFTVASARAGETAPAASSLKVGDEDDWGVLSGQCRNDLSIQILWKSLLDHSGNDMTFTRTYLVRAQVFQTAVVSFTSTAL